MSSGKVLDILTLLTCVIGVYHYSKKILDNEKG